MDSEKDFCADYLRNQPNAYRQEVPVGNCVLKANESIQTGFEGPAAGSIDGLHSPADTPTEKLIECKREPTFTGLGQILLYSYFRRRDREVVWDWYETRGSPWETKRGIAGFESHLRTDSSGGTVRYIPKPRTVSIERSLVVGEVSPESTALLSAYADLGIRIQHRTGSTWRELNASLFDNAPPNRSPDPETWLETRARETLDSDDEERLAREFIEHLVAVGGFDTVRALREIPVGSRLYPDQSTPLRADLVVHADDRWFVVEIKNGSARRDFQKAFGQAVGYASVFRREWGLPCNRVVPAVVQNPLPVMGLVYSDDRYDDYERMFAATLTNPDQPFIFNI